MARLVGYMANRTDRLAAALYQERAVVTPPPTPTQTGWGVGFYQAGEVLHKKRPQVDLDTFDWSQVARDVTSDCVVLHLRQPTVGDFRSHNTHPFRMRSWLFAHSGTIGRFEALRHSLLSSLPDFLARNIRGKTDSEHFFHIILSFLHDAGQLDSTDVAPASLLSAIRSAIALVDRLSAEVQCEPATMNLVLTNGRTMVAVRRGLPMAWVSRQGLHDPPPDLELPKTPSHSQLRYTMVVSGATEKAPKDWTPLEDGQALVVDRNLSPEMCSL